LYLLFLGLTFVILWSMPLPETIAIRFTEEDAGYVTVRPVVRQTFRLGDLADMVLSVTGKNTPRVQQIFRAGTVVYNGYRYWWDGFTATEEEIAALLVPFPDDEPSRPFNAAAVRSVSLESGGGTQRIIIGLTRQEASAKRLFQSRSLWDILLAAAKDSPPRYEKYSHTDRADVYRVYLSPQTAVSLQNELLEVAPRNLRRKLASLKPPASLLFFIPRAHSSEAGSAT
jgi:hypothetical protein